MFKIFDGKQLKKDFSFELKYISYTEVPLQLTLLIISESGKCREEEYY